jgi:Fic family protein
MRGRFVDRTWKYDPTLIAPARFRRACRYRAFVPEIICDAGFAMSPELAGVVSEAERELQELNAAGGAILDPLARLLLRTESIASSRIEGLNLHVDDLARAEAKSEFGLDIGENARGVLSNIDAMVLAVEDASAAPKFGEEELLTIHRRLIEKAPHRHIAGRIRDEQNWIGGNDHNPCGADFVPPPPEDVPRLLADLYAAINDDLLPPMVQAALVHAQFETIHPFGDGNGRVGRALVHVVFRRRGVAPRFVPPISVVFARNKDRYIEGLTRFREDDLQSWIEQFASATMRAAGMARHYIERVLLLRDAWREQLRRLPHVPRSDAAVWALIDILPGNPMLTAPAAVALTRRAKARVYEGIAVLEKVGVLQPLSKGKRNRIWEAAGLVDLMADLDAGRTGGRRIHDK